MRDSVEGKSFVISKEKAEVYVPILKWIKEGAPRVRERRDAAAVLREFKGIKDWKQVILSRGEMEMLRFVMEEFPEGSMLGKQLKLPGV